jgi:N-acetylmuramoyl-L-alanine amidase
MGRILAGLAAFWLSLAGAPAEELSARARLDPAASRIAADGEGTAVLLALSQPVPWRVRFLDAPPRLVIDSREVDWTGIAAVPRTAPAVRDLRAGVFRPGWSRLVLELAGPVRLVSAEMTTGVRPAIALRLAPAEPAAFAARAALPDPPGWSLPAPALPPAPAAADGGPLVVVLDPGHGGLDPGAERDGLSEAALMLTFARELKDELLRAGGFRVVMTREEDVFVPLETRISIARAAGGDVFLSLHADALAEGEAVGATLYTLSGAASDRAAATLAERHDRADLLSGVDLSGQDDLVAQVLMDMARTETRPRIERLALSLETAIRAEGLRLHRRPRQSGAFSVLKSPDIPSVLVELGFLSSAGDVQRLTDPAWRARMARALRLGLRAWAAGEARLGALPR